jgi:hypothetical protein
MTKLKFAESLARAAMPGRQGETSCLRDFVVEKHRSGSKPERSC